MCSVVCLCRACHAEAQLRSEHCGEEERLHLCHFSAWNKRLVTTSSFLVPPCFSKNSGGCDLLLFSNYTDFLLSDQTRPTFVACLGLINQVLVSLPSILSWWISRKFMFISIYFFIYLPLLSLHHSVSFNHSPWLLMNIIVGMNCSFQYVRLCS